MSDIEKDMAEASGAAARRKAAMAEAADERKVAKAEAAAGQAGCLAILLFLGCPLLLVLGLFNIPLSALVSLIGAGLFSYMGMRLWQEFILN